MHEALDAIRGSDGQEFALVAARDGAHTLPSGGLSTALAGRLRRWVFAVGGQIQRSAYNKMGDARRLEMAYLDLSVYHEDVLACLSGAGHLKQSEGIAVAHQGYQAGKGALTDMKQASHHPDLDGRQRFAGAAIEVFAGAVRESGPEEADPVEQQRLPGTDTHRRGLLLFGDKVVQSLQEGRDAPGSLSQGSDGATGLLGIKSGGTECREEGSSAAQ